MMAQKSKTILIIDDEAGLLESLVAFLEDEDYVVFKASSGEEGLEIIKNEEIGVAIVDMRLPGMDGNNVIQKAITFGKKTRFLIHTGSSNYQLPDRLLDHGISEAHVFHKPLPDMMILVHAIENLLQLS